MRGTISSSEQRLVKIGSHVLNTTPRKNRSQSIVTKHFFHLSDFKGALRIMIFEFFAF